MITVVFCRPKKFSLASLIFRFVEGAPYSHAALLMPNGFFYHVTLLGKVHINSSIYFRKIYEIIEMKNLYIEPDNYGLMLADASRLEGVEYGIMTVLGAGVARLLNLFGIKTPNFFRDKTKTFYCSEFVYHILKVGGIHLKGFRPEIDGPKRLNEELNHDTKSNI